MGGKKLHHKQKAFTIIELLVVIAIIGILAALGIVAYSGYTSGAKKNASKITIFPYFLNSGVHIKSDIPVIVEKAKVKYDNCTFKLTLPIGAYKGMAKLISEQINLS